MADPERADVSAQTQPTGLTEPLSQPGADVSEAVSTKVSTSGWEGGYV